METDLLPLPNLGPGSDQLFFLDPSFFASPGLCFSPREHLSPRNHFAGSSNSGNNPTGPSHGLHVASTMSGMPDLADWDSTGSVGSRRCSDEFSEASVQQKPLPMAPPTAAATQACWKKACEYFVAPPAHMVMPKPNHPRVDMAPQVMMAPAPKKDEVRLFACKEAGCDKVYTTTEGLRLHNRNIHMNDKRHKCTVEGCDRAFVRASDLKLHVLRIHEVSRPFPCTEPDCTKSFACNSELTRHLNCHKRNRSGRKKQRLQEDSETDDEY